MFCIGQDQIVALAVFLGDWPLPGKSVSRVYFSVTVRVAEPPRLLLRVILCGFVGQENSPRYRPPPSLRKVPISALVELT